MKIRTSTGQTVGGDLVVPENAKGVILFAHGSGSGRLSPRNRYVAEYLQQASFGTLLMDLLTEEEEESRENAFDIELLASRLMDVAHWLSRDRRVSGLPVGLFGASTGAAAALVAAGKAPGRFAAIVSRGGRPDLADRFLPRVLAPTLLIVGGNDDMVIELNERALERLTCEKALSIVAGATHLFEEEGTLERVADLATHWFDKHRVGVHSRERLGRR